MKKMRKGFTLIELLVVIAIMGILGGMAMIGGQEATNAAKAARIVDGLEKGASAMMSYYIDVHESIDKVASTAQPIDAATIATGASYYLKADSQLENTATEGKYCVAVDETEKGAGMPWFIGYKFAGSDGDKVKGIIANKAAGLKLYSTAVSKDNTIYTTGDTVYMKVRP